TAHNGFGHVHAQLTTPQNILVALAISGMVTLAGVYFIYRVPSPPSGGRGHQFKAVERVFSVLMVVTACALAFAHGSNDVSIAVGPLAAIVSVAKSGNVLEQAPVPMWVLLLGGVGIVLGLATFGRHVIATV